MIRGSQLALSVAEAKPSRPVPLSAGRGVWVPAFAGTTSWVGLTSYPTSPCIGFTTPLSGNTLSASTFSASPN